MKTDVARLVAGPTVYICNECVELCEDVIAARLRCRVRPWRGCLVTSGWWNGASSVAISDGAAPISTMMKNHW